MTSAADARLTEAEKKIREAAKAKEAAKAAQLRKDFNETFGTGAGKNVLRAIYEWSGYDRSSVVVDEVGNPQAEGTIYNAAQQNIYRRIRRMLHRDILIPVEHDGLEKDEVDIFS